MLLMSHARIVVNELYSNYYVAIDKKIKHEEKKEEEEEIKQRGLYMPSCLIQANERNIQNRKLVQLANR